MVAAAEGGLIPSPACGRGRGPPRSGGRVRVFFLLFQLNSLGRRKKTLTQTLSRVRERAFR